MRDGTLLLVVFVLAAGCTSRTREIVKEQYVITDVICDRIDNSDPQKQPTRQELYGFVVGTRDTFDTLKKKGTSISISVYATAVTLSDRISKNENIDMDELRQFVKQTRDAYGLILEKKK